MTKLVLRHLIGFLNGVPEAARPPADEFMDVIRQAVPIFDKEPPLLRLDGSFVIVGDIHGDMDALRRIINEVGYPPETQFLFLGDYVDRGERSCEVMLFLLSLKVLFPEKVFMIRGNHESRDQTSYCGFKDECHRKYGDTVYEALMHLFSKLPIAAIVNETAFCVHGGLSPQIKTRDDLKLIEKLESDSFDGVVGDLLWSDFETYVEGCVANVERGCGFMFGADYTKKWMNECGFKYVIRSHQSCDDGFEWVFGEDVGCVTVFSSIDYLQQANEGAILKLGKDSLNFGKFRPILSRKQKPILRSPGWILEDKIMFNSVGAVERVASDPVSGRAETNELEIRV